MCRGTLPRRNAPAGRFYRTNSGVRWKGITGLSVLPATRW